MWLGESIVRQLAVAALTLLSRVLGTAMLSLATACSAADVVASQAEHAPTIVNRETAQSRYGLLTLHPRDANNPESTPILAFEGRVVALPLGDLPGPEVAGAFRKAVAVGESDLLVVEFGTDAARCPIELRVIEVTRSGARASESFGNCTLLKAAEVRAGRLWMEPHAWRWPYPDYQTTEPRRRMFTYAAGRLTMVYERLGAATYTAGRNGSDPPEVER